MLLTRHVLAVAILVAVAGCRFEDRTPGGARRDDLSLDRVATQFYGALARHDTVALARIVFPTATALVDGGRSPAALVPVTAVLDVPGTRTSLPSPRIVRTELRADGGAATARVVISTAFPVEMEAVDVLTLAREDGGWRVAHVLFGPWRVRAQ
ncbi:MAG: hypothetical protein ABIR59_08500 [Gemmatimonadales bacterium]